MPRLHLRLALALLLIALPAAAQAPLQVAIPDGNTLRFNNTTWRLWGIDAPDADHLCDDGWPAGREATKGLRAMVEGRILSCEPRDKDRFGNTIALCRANGVDLSGEMVRAGLAWAFVHETQDYVDLERDAVGSRIGVHDHACLLPAAWRDQHKVPRKPAQ